MTSQGPLGPTMSAGPNMPMNGSMGQQGMEGQFRPVGPQMGSNGSNLVHNGPMGP